MKPGWTEVALGDLISPAPVSRSDGDGLPVLTMTKSHGLVEQTTFFKKRIAGRDLSKYKVVMPGDLVVGIHVDEGALGVSHRESPGIVSPAYGIWTIRDSAGVDAKYLDRYLASERATRYLQSKYRATAHRRGKLTQEDFKALPVGLPPLEEQQRIAAILDKADDLLAKRRAAIAHLDSLTQAIFTDTFGDPVGNPLGLPVHPLADIVEFLDSKRRPITAADREPGPVPYYGANGIQDHVADHIFDEPLVLLAEDGGYFDQPWRGIAYRIEGRSWVNNHAHVMRPRQQVDGRFLTAAIRHRDVMPFLTGSTRAKLTKSAAARIPVAVPTEADQSRFASLDERVDLQRARLVESTSVIENLTAALRARAFRGEL